VTKVFKYSVVVLSLFVACNATADNSKLYDPALSGRHYNGVDRFSRMDPDSADPNGNTVNKNCSGNFPAARAAIRVRSRGQRSRVKIWIRDAQPDSLYTFWLRLKGKTDAGVDFGGSPLTGGGSTPLAPSWALDSLLESTGSSDGVTNGTRSIANGVRTNSDGNANFSLHLDFPIFDGAYPFQHMENFDPDDSRYPIDNPALHPVAIVNPEAPRISAPFLIRMVSHCTDELGHGLTPGAREPWFQYP